MTLVDLIKDCLDTTKERLKTPISGAFLWSFLIFNWRPVFLLLFSNETIENKIIVINHEYCTFWALFFPVLFAILYTILVPKLMLEIDKDLAETKKSRIDKIYESRSHTMEKKIKIAEQDYTLKNALSGNKKIDELLGQIDSMKTSNEVIKQADELRIVDLSSKLKEANDLNAQLNEDIAKLQTRIQSSFEDRQNFVDLSEDIEAGLYNLNPDLHSKIVDLSRLLTFEDYQLMRAVKVDTNGFISFDYNSVIDSLSLNRLIDCEILINTKVKNRNILKFSENGKILYKIINGKHEN
ncbi:hypothetical protein EOD40_15195 [Flavobacterium sufflavum]|uniref:Uncharacterized protein n=1 Tax=Flavobacterium sufflavum TaxID=1921138 RepID=A0A437KMZ8_9FLAO|nr:hypothetical protein [Flavobacterium sufflavum]RVT72756.1 hypothetical protein EOD40_15195 [Flavobacterium sufflavum]